MGAFFGNFMSTAQEVIQSAFNKIGRGSEILTTDQSLLDEGLLELKSIMEELRKNEIILAETVNGVTTTIALPTLLADELDEPVASRQHLVNILAVNAMSLSRAKPDKVFAVPPVSYSLGRLEKLYSVHTVPDKVPSRLLPRGQGARYGQTQGAFFRGEAIDPDVTESS